MPGLNEFSLPDPASGRSLYGDCPHATKTPSDNATPAIAGLQSVFIVWPRRRGMDNAAQQGDGSAALGHG
jgi:hypothetical protein